MYAGLLTFLWWWKKAKTKYFYSCKIKPHEVINENKYNRTPTVSMGDAYIANKSNPSYYKSGCLKGKREGGKKP